MTMPCGCDTFPWSKTTYTVAVPHGWAVWVTLLLPTAAKAIVGELVAMGWGVAALSSDDKLVHGPEKGPMCVLALGIAARKDKKAPDLVGDVKRACDAAGASFYSLVVVNRTDNSDTTWCAGTVRLPEDGDKRLGRDKLPRVKRNPRIAAVVDTATALADPLIVLRRALGGDDAAIDAVAHAWGARAPENNRQADAWYKAALVGWAASLRSPLTVRSYTRTIVAFWDWVARDRVDRAGGGEPEFLAPHDLNANDVARFVGALSGATTPTAWQCAALLGKRGGDPDTVELARAAVEVAHHEWAKQQGAILRRDQLVELTVGQLKAENNARLASIADDWANNPGYIVEPQLARECQRFDWVLSKMVIGGYLYREPTYEQFVSQFGDTVGDHEELRKKDGKYPPYPYKEAVYRKPKAKEGTQPTTVAQRLACLASFWKRLLQEQMNTERPKFLSFNPWPEHLRAFDRAGKDARPGRIAQRKTSIEDFRLLMGCLYDLGKSKAQPSVRSVLARRDMLAVLVMTVMGLRVSEMCALRRSSVGDIVDTNGQLVRRMFVKRKGRKNTDGEPVPVPESVLAAHDMMLHAMRDLLNKYSKDAGDKELQVPPEIARRRHYYIAILKAYLGSREVPFVPAFARWGNAIQKTLMVVRKDQWDKAADQDMRQWEGYEVAATGDDTTQNTMFSVFVPWDADGVRKMLHDYVPRIAPGGQVKAMRMRLHPHGLRHLHAALAQRGVSFSLDRLQESLGHASPETTELYMDGPYAIERKQDAVEAAMAAMLGLRPRTPPRPAEPPPSPAPAGEEGSAPVAPTRAPSGGGGAGGIVPPAQTPAPRPKKEPKPRVGAESPIVPGSRSRRPTQTPEEALAQKRAIEGKAGEKLRIAQDRARDRLFPPGGEPIVAKDEIARVLREEMVAVGLDPDAYAWGEKVTVAPPLSPEELEAEESFQRATFLAAEIATTFAVQPPPAEDPPVVAIVEADLPPVPPGTPPPAETPAEPARPAKAPKAPKAPKAKAPKAPTPPPPAKAIIAIGSLYREKNHGPYFPPGDDSFYSVKPILPLPSATLEKWWADGWIPPFYVISQVNLPPSWLKAKVWTGARTLLPYLALTNPGLGEIERASGLTPSNDGWEKMKPNARGVAPGERVAMPLLRLDTEHWADIESGVMDLLATWSAGYPTRARALPLWVGMMFTHSLLARHKTMGRDDMVWLGFAEEVEERNTGVRAPPEDASSAVFDQWRKDVRNRVAREHDPAAIVRWLDRNGQTWHGQLKGVWNLSDAQERQRAAGASTAEGIETILDYLAIARGEHPAAGGVGLQRYPVPGWMMAEDPIGDMPSEEREAMRKWLRATLPRWSNVVTIQPDYGSPLSFEPVLRAFIDGAETMYVHPDAERSAKGFAKQHGVDPLVACRRVVRVMWELRRGMKGETKAGKMQTFQEAWGLIWAWILPTRDEVERHLAATVGQEWRETKEKSIREEFARVADLNMIMGLMPSIEDAIGQLMREAEKVVGRDPTLADLATASDLIAKAVWSPLLDKFTAAKVGTKDRSVIVRIQRQAIPVMYAAAEQVAAGRGLPTGDKAMQGAMADPGAFTPEKWREWATWDKPEDGTLREEKLASLGLPTVLSDKTKAEVSDYCSHVRAFTTVVKVLILQSVGPLSRVGAQINRRLSGGEIKGGLEAIERADEFAKAFGTIASGGSFSRAAAIEAIDDPEKSSVGLEARIRGSGSVKDDEVDPLATTSGGKERKDIPKRQRTKLTAEEELALLLAEQASEMKQGDKDKRYKKNLSGGDGTSRTAPLLPGGWSAVKGMRLNLARIWWLLTA